MFFHSAVFSAVGTLQSVYSYFLTFLITAVLQNPSSLASVPPHLSAMTDIQTYKETDRHRQANKSTDFAPALPNENGVYILCYYFLKE